MKHRFSTIRSRPKMALLGAACCLTLGGCHSAFVQATVLNQTGHSIHLFEVDYPNASFGSGELAPGATFRYRFKILGTGPAKLTWTDDAEHDHTAQGPELHEGQEGTLAVTIGAGGAEWQSQLHERP